MEEAGREIEDVLAAQRKGGVQSKLLFAVRDAGWIGPLQQKYGNLNIGFTIQEGNLSSSVEMFAPGVTSVNVLISRRMALSEAALSSLRQLQGSSQWRVALFVLLEDTLQMAVPVSIQELTDLNLARERLVATQA